MGFEIVTDSSANLPNEIIEKYNIRVLSLVVRAGDNEFLSYVSNKETDYKKFYTMMNDGIDLMTSQINPLACAQTFEQCLSEGKDVLYIGFSSTLSGTFHVAEMTADDLIGSFPERKIKCFDTLAASAGEGLLVLRAAQLRDEGKSMDDVCKWLWDNYLNACHWFTVDDLSHLKRGGRISGAAAVVGTMLNIKPIFHMDSSGRLVPVGKVRGRKTALNTLTDKMKEHIRNPENQTIFITHADCDEDAEYLRSRINEQFSVKDIIIIGLDPVIGCHTGPGTIAVYFMGDER